MNDKVGLVIGRFQPIHDGHTILIKEAAKRSDRLIILVGSANASITTRNPFTFPERLKMIETATQFMEIPVTILPVDDFFYVENGWLKEVQRIVMNDIRDEERVTLFGHYKDATSSYLNWFPQWDFFPVNKELPIDATMIRDFLFTGYSSKLSEIMNPDVVSQWIEPFMGISRYFELVEEYKHTIEYKRAWENSPFPPTFVTCDAVVAQSGHVLVVKRKRNPGRGKWAIPGGFLDQHERTIDGSLRELKEETKIDLPKPILKSSIVDSNVFDYPWRSSRGRTITHAFYYKLDDSKSLPKVLGADDAEEAKWMPFNEVAKNAQDFFEDHFHIIKYFIGL